MENYFENLDAPVKRVASLEMLIPFASSLEKSYLPLIKFELKLQELLRY